LSFALQKQRGGVVVTLNMQGLNVDIPVLVEKMKGSIVLQDRKFLGKSMEKSFTGKSIHNILTPFA
jgi:hypothetical protein